MAKFSGTLCLIGFLIVLAFSQSCKNPPSGKKDLIAGYYPDTTSIQIEYGHVVICIPSPHRVTKYLYDNNFGFRDELALKPLPNTNYQTNFQKAIHMGIFGTNQGYQLVFSKDRDSMALFLKVKELAGSLDLLDAIDRESINKIEQRRFENDTILSFLANSYRNVNTFSRLRNKQNLSALIIAGGWIESFYLLSEMQNYYSNEDLEHLLAEHKFSLNKLIEILSPYYESTREFKELIDNLVDLAYDFDAVEYQYAYEEAEVYANKGLTVVKGKTKIYFSDELKGRLKNKINKIRNDILFAQS